MRMSGGDYHVNECGICVLPWVCNSLWFCAGRVWRRFAQAGLGLHRQGGVCSGRVGFAQAGLGLRRQGWVCAGRVCADWVCTGMTHEVKLVTLA